jgi:ferrous iron transport protein B
MNAPILLLGNQNAGKTTLFNALTGLSAKVANYPGITVEARVGEIARYTGEKVKIIDLPGTYSLIPTSQEEELTVKTLFGQISGLREHSLIVLVIDCTELRRGLYLYLQIIELGFKAIIALSMVDQRPELWHGKDITKLKKSVGGIIVPVSVNNQASIKNLTSTIDSVLAGAIRPQIKEQPLLFNSLSKELIQKLSSDAPSFIGLPFHAQKSLDLIRNHNIFLYGLARRRRLNKDLKDLNHLDLAREDMAKLDELIGEIPEQRFKKVDHWLKHLTTDDDLLRKKSDLLDKFLLHPIIGCCFLLALFVFMLQGLFLIAEPLADLVGEGISNLGELVGSFLPAQSMVRSLVLDGIFEGVGSILSFLPLIILLFLFLSFLEDSGYLARATYLLDSTMKHIGLNGRSLVPMLSGFACAVPAIMAARTIGNRKERLITILVTPFLTCSARLPVFGLIVGALFSNFPPLFGVINVGALMFLSMYVLGLMASLISAFLLSKVIKTDDFYSLAIELPPYRWPNLFSIVKRVIDRIYVFMRDVGSVILASTIIIWALFHFEPNLPKETMGKTNIEILKTKSEKRDLSRTYAGKIGQVIEPIISPMGLDWQVGVGILASFLAREVFVSTMAVVYGLSDEKDVNLKSSFKNHMSPLSGFCLLIFFTLSMQCISTMATTRRETGSILWPMLQFIMMSGSGYILSVMVYGIGNAIGWS